MQTKKKNKKVIPMNEQKDELDKIKFLNALKKCDGAVLNKVMQDITIAIGVVQDHVKFRLSGIDDYSKIKLFVDEKKVNRKISERLKIQEDNYVTLLPYPDNTKYLIFYINRVLLLKHLLNDSYPNFASKMRDFVNNEEELNE